MGEKGGRERGWFCRPKTPPPSKLTVPPRGCARRLKRCAHTQRSACTNLDCCQSVTQPRRQSRHGCAVRAHERHGALVCSATTKAPQPPPVLTDSHQPRSPVGATAPHTIFAKTHFTLLCLPEPAPHAMSAHATWFVKESVPFYPAKKERELASRVVTCTSPTFFPRASPRCNAALPVLSESECGQLWTRVVCQHRQVWNSGSDTGSCWDYLGVQGQQQCFQRAQCVGSRCSICASCNSGCVGI